MDLQLHNKKDYEKQNLLPFGPIEETLEKCRYFNHAAHNEKGRWRLTPKGFLLSNTIISCRIDIKKEEAPKCLHNEMRITNYERKHLRYQLLLCAAWV